MTYPLNPELMYMMPTHFGPMCGPRQGPGGKKFAFLATIAGNGYAFPGVILALATTFFLSFFHILVKN